MPFDATDFDPHRRPTRKPAPVGDNAITLIIVALAFALLVFPISLAAFADLVHYLRRP